MQRPVFMLSEYSGQKKNYSHINYATAKTNHFEVHLKVRTLSVTKEHFTASKQVKASVCTMYKVTILCLELAHMYKLIHL
jgi:hypothetical protein